MQDRSPHFNQDVELKNEDFEKSLQLNSLKSKLVRAQSLGIDVPFDLPEASDPLYRDRYREMQRFIEGRLDEHYEKFGKSLAQDPQMRILIMEYNQAVLEERRSTSGNFSLLTHPSFSRVKKRLQKRTSKVLGGVNILQKGEMAIIRREELENKIISLLCAKYERAGLNNDPYRSISTSSINIAQALEIMGV
ncbi:MAG: hypothetical protein JWN37_472 [Candidatus Nomurabacteria bacterium]|nr:hypothetical protein [Candidatus Nomurabacteria bacterium]